MTNVSYAEVAKLAQQLVAQAKVNATPNDLALAGLVHQMLDGIATGKLVVGAPVEDVPAEPVE